MVTREQGLTQRIDRIDSANIPLLLLVWSSLLLLVHYDVSLCRFLCLYLSFSQGVKKIRQFS